MKKGNPLYLVFFLAAVIAGTGCSLIEWGDPKGVHATGWPLPTIISGLPEEASPALELVANLGFMAIFLNIALAMLAGFFLWGVVALATRLIRGA